MTAPARAAACASGERCAIRAMTASSIVPGTLASRIALPSARVSALNAPRSSSIWSGIPSVRPNTAAETSLGAGSPVSRIRVVTRAVSVSVNGASFTSSATRWVMSRARQSRRLAPGATSSVR